MARRFNAKKKPKHMSKNRWIDCGEDGYCLFNGAFCKAHSWGFASKFKFAELKLTKKWEECYAF